VNGIARLAQDLMDAIRVDRGILRRSKANMEIVFLLTDTREITASVGAAKKQVFTVLIPDRTTRVEGDPVRLTWAEMEWTPRQGAGGIFG
jgi:hypothetical protein